MQVADGNYTVKIPEHHGIARIQQVLDVEKSGLGKHHPHSNRGLYILHVQIAGRCPFTKHYHKDWSKCIFGMHESVLYCLTRGDHDN